MKCNYYHLFLIPESLLLFLYIFLNAAVPILVITSFSFFLKTVDFQAHNDNDRLPVFELIVLVFAFAYLSLIQLASLAIGFSYLGLCRLVPVLSPAYTLLVNGVSILVIGFVILNGLWLIGALFFVFMTILFLISMFSAISSLWGSSSTIQQSLSMAAHLLWKQPLGLLFIAIFSLVQITFGSYHFFYPFRSLGLSYEDTLAEWILVCSIHAIKIFYFIVLSRISFAFARFYVAKLVGECKLDRSSEMNIKHATWIMAKLYIPVVSLISTFSGPLTGLLVYSLALDFLSLIRLGMSLSPAPFQSWFYRTIIARISPYVNDWAIAEMAESKQFFLAASKNTWVIMTEDSETHFAAIDRIRLQTALFSISASSLFVVIPIALFVGPFEFDILYEVNLLLYGITAMVFSWSVLQNLVGLLAVALSTSQYWAKKNSHPSSPEFSATGYAPPEPLDPLEVQSLEMTSEASQ